MSFDALIGQPLAVDLCRHWLKKNTTNPLLFYGPEGVGKKLLAIELAKALNCKPSPALRAPSPKLGEGRALPSPDTGEGGRRPDEGCGECLSCRKIAAGSHPDVRVIDFAWQALERKEPLEKQQSLKIETILAERHRLLQSAVEGSWKVSILDDAHRLTADAANVLLKILEEPPAQTLIVLSTPFRDRLFATLLSRCQPVRFRALSDPDMAKCLAHQGVPSDMHARLTELALGSPGHAMHLNRAEQIESSKMAERLWQSLKTMSPAQALHETGGRKSTKPTRHEMEQHVNSLLTAAARALRTGDMGAQEPVTLIQTALTQLRQNVQPALVYDNLLIQLSRDAHRRPA